MWPTRPRGSTGPTLAAAAVSRHPPQAPRQALQSRTRGGSPAAMWSSWARGPSRPAGRPRRSAASCPWCAPLPGCAACASPWCCFARWVAAFQGMPQAADAGCHPALVCPLCGPLMVLEGCLHESAASCPQCTHPAWLSLLQLRTAFGLQQAVCGSQTLPLVMRQGRLMLRGRLDACMGASYCL